MDGTPRIQTRKVELAVAQIIASKDEEVAPAKAPAPQPPKPGLRRGADDQIHQLRDRPIPEIGRPAVGCDLHVAADGRLIAVQGFQPMPQDEVCACHSRTHMACRLDQLFKADRDRFFRTDQSQKFEKGVADHNRFWTYSQRECELFTWLWLVHAHNGCILLLRFTRYRRQLVQFGQQRLKFYVMNPTRLSQGYSGGHRLTHLRVLERA